MTDLRSEVDRLNRELASRNYEMNARADLLMEERTRVEAVAKVCDRLGYVAIAESLREAIAGPPGHPDDLGDGR